MKYSFSLSRFILLLSFCAVGLAACDGHKSDAGGSPSPRELVQSDLAALSQIDFTAVRAFDTDQRGLFTQIFGGTDGAAVNDYLFTRIHYFYAPNDLRRLRSTPDDFRYKGWRSSDDNHFTPFGEVQVGAANIGTEIWLNGLLDQVPVTVYDGDTRIAVESSRVGLMLIGPGYRAVENVDGRDIAIPASYRQGILLHEARHSDCTGGITESDLQILRESRSMRETDMRFKNRACGHLHTYCPSGHDYAGYLACDDRDWGAYAIQYVFYRAVLANSHGLDRAILDAAIVDTRSRLLTGFESMGRPDMSSEGLR